MSAADRDDMTPEDLEALQETLRKVGAQGAPAPPRAGLWDRVQGRIRNEDGGGSTEDGTTIFDTAVRAALIQRAATLGWMPTPFPGIRAKLLARGPGAGRWTLLVEMSPGADFPAHGHGDVERLVLLDGDLRFADRTMERGDRVQMEAGSHHGAASTGPGCTLLYEGSQGDWAPAG